MRLFRPLATIALAAIAVSKLSYGAVTGIDVAERGEVANGVPFGNTGAYEYLAGKVHFAVDSKLAPNRIIADLDLAPKNARGRVEFAADFYILKPRDAQKGNGTALVEISNRGGKSLAYEFDLAHAPFDPRKQEAVGDGFLLKQGFTLVWIGWEFDVPPKPGLLRAYLPIATDAGEPIIGVVRSEWVGEKIEPEIPLGDKGQVGYPALDSNSPANKLFVRASVLGKRSVIPHSRWRFSDATHVALDGGFEPGLIYEVVYQTQNPPVAGLGLAAVRDFTSFLKHGSEAITSNGGEGLTAQRAIAFGVSQSGRFLREFLYDGFNEDELHRKVFDGVWAHVAGAGRGSFNHRFAQPSRDGHEFTNVFYPVDVPPFDEESLLERAHRTHVVPKLFLSNGEYEYWGRCASLIHTTADGKADMPPSNATRIYFFSDSQHTVGTIPPKPANTQNATNTNDYRYALRALLVAMQKWLANDIQPPLSQFPQLAKGQLTTLTGLEFPHIRGVAVPRVKREAYRLDFSKEPPIVGAPFPTYIPQVDPDGNDVAGIKMPEIAVPLASYTGWNLRSPQIGSPTELMPFLGSYIPFARTAEERAQRKDPRAAVSQRYPSEEEYLRRIDEAARTLAERGYLLTEDLRLIDERAQQEWRYVHSEELHTGVVASEPAH